MAATQQKITDEAKAWIGCGERHGMRRKGWTGRRRLMTRPEKDKEAN